MRKGGRKQGKKKILPLTHVKKKLRIGSKQNALTIRLQKATPM